MRREGGTDRQTVTTKLIVGLSILRMHLTELRSTFLPQSAFRCYIWFCHKTTTFVCIHSLAGSCNRISIVELLPVFRKVLVSRTIFCSCLALKMSAARSLECLCPFTSQRQPIHGCSLRRKRRYSELVSGRWNGEHCCMVDRVTNAEISRDPIRTRSQQWLTVSHGNGEAV
jgi:hypothetical protein